MKKLLSIITIILFSFLSSYAWSDGVGRKIIFNANFPICDTLSGAINYYKYYHEYSRLERSNPRVRDFMAQLSCWFYDTEDHTEDYYLIGRDFFVYTLFYLKEHAYSGGINGTGMVFVTISTVPETETHAGYVSYDRIKHFRNY